MLEGTHLETLEFELKAAKSKLESEQGIMESYWRSYCREYNNFSGFGSDLQMKASYATWKEYHDKHIPRTKRMIAALEHVLQKVDINLMERQIAQLRHMYKQMTEDHVNAPVIARGILGPVIQNLEKIHAQHN